jgi:hypothetical protein
LQAQSTELLNNEKGYNDFKFGEVVVKANTEYQLDTKRSTEEIKAYQHKGECCTHLKGLKIDGIILYLNVKEELSQIEFIIEESKSLSELGQYFFGLQNHYGLFSDYVLATGNEKTSSFFWRSDSYELTMRMTQTDASKEKYRAELILAQY